MHECKNMRIKVTSLTGILANHMATKHKLNTLRTIIIVKKDMNHNKHNIKTKDGYPT